MLFVNHLWEGIFPCEIFPRNDREYHKAASQSNKLYDALRDKLDAEDRHALDELLEAHSNHNDIAHKDAFALGIRFGAMLMIDVFCKD